jgi:sulfur-oxidizing protein SoxY
MHTSLPIGRRRLLKGASAVTAVIASGVGLSSRAAAAPGEALAFAAHSFPEVIGALGGMPKVSARIALELPQVAENGAFVPITVNSGLPGTSEILIVVDGNPQPLAVRFTIPAGTEPFVATRIRMAQSGTVYVAVRSDEGLCITARAVQVIAGGCA